MLRAIVSAVVALCVSSVALADELKGVINKIDADKVTFTEGVLMKGVEAKTYDLAKDVKVFRFVGKNQKEVDPDGLKAEPLPNLPKGGLLAVINVVDGKVKEITIPPKKKN